MYGRIGNKRIPLPACAYSEIRKQFPVNKDENFTGFDLDKTSLDKIMLGGQCKKLLAVTALPKVTIMDIYIALTDFKHN